jgi:ABC-type antimicrobial peptide transport system permease subunit
MLKITFRHLRRFKKASILNISGLAIGIAAAIIIFMILRFENSFDTYQPHYTTTYRLVTQTDYTTGSQYNSGVSTGVPAAIKAEFPQVQTIAAIQAIDAAQFSTSDSRFRETKGTWFIEPQWFKLFPQTWLAGSPAQLAAPNTIALDKTTAAKYFGSWQKAIGQLLQLDNNIPLKVTGILDTAPDNTDFPLSMVISFETLRQHPGNYGYEKDDWSGISGNHQVFVELPDPSTIAHQLKQFSEQHYASQTIRTRQLLLLPLSENHFDSRFGYLVPHISSHTRLMTLTFIGILMLLMAVINFINLTTAQSAIRSKEIGVRKVLGSNRRQLITQLLFETGTQVIIAIIIAVLIAQLTLPALRFFTNLPASLTVFTRANAACLLTLLLTITLLAGTYPAFILSGYKPLTAFKPGGYAVRRGLIITQFAISQVMIIGTIVAMSQVRLLQSADLGFNKDAVYIAEGFGDYNLNAADALKNRLKQYAGFTSITLASAPPASAGNWMDNFYFDNSPQSGSYNIDIKCGDADYAHTFGLQLIAGRNYQDGEHVREMLINQTLVKELGFKNPADAIGHTLKIGDTGEWRQIVGVIRDFTNNSLREKIRPTALMPWRDANSITCVRFTDPKMLDVLKDEWMKAFPGYVFNGSFLSQHMQDYYQQEQQLSALYRLFAGIALFISCLGLYGMVSFMAVQKKKEIGIRKVLGASVVHILYLFWKEFLLLTGIAFLLAAPAGWWLMNNWLQHFTLRTAIGAPVFLAAIIASAVIALLTVSHKAMTAALTNPVKSIQTE